MADQLDTLLSEERRFPPPAEFAARAVGTSALYEAAARDRLAFWEEQARALDWMTPWTSVLQWHPPARPLVRRGHAECRRQLPRPAPHRAPPQQGRHHLGGRAGRSPRLYLLGRWRARSAAPPMRSSGSGSSKGDRVAIYLPMIPEAAIAMLACARIGAVHSVVFGGFSAESLRDRINDAQAVA